MAWHVDKSIDKDMKMTGEEKKRVIKTASMQQERKSNYF